MRAAGGPDLVIEVVVVDDGSTDGTADRVRECDAPGTTLLRHDANRGKGAAIRTGLAAVSGDAVIIQDADLEYDPADYRPIVQALKAGAPAVYGSRILGRNPSSYLRYYYGGRILTLVFNLLYGARLTDLTTCYKAFPRAVIASLPLASRRFEFCAEVSALLARTGHPIVEVPIGYRPRSLAQGKKIRWHDGLQAVGTLLALRWRAIGGARRAGRGAVL